MSSVNCKVRLSLRKRPSIPQTMPPLHAAIKENNIQLIRTLLTQNADVNEFFKGYAPIHLLFSGFGSFEILKLLLEAGADVKAVSKWSKTPLHLFSASSPQKDLKLAKFLLEKGADVNAQDVEGNTPLHYASLTNWIELVKLFLNYNADVNVVNNYGENSFLSVFMWISDSSYFDLGKILVDHGLSVQCNKVGKTPVHRLELMKDLISLKYFYKIGIDFNALDLEGRTALMSMLNYDAEVSNKDIKSMDKGVSLMGNDEIFCPISGLEFMLERTNVNFIDINGKSILDLCPKMRPQLRTILQHIAKLKVLDLLVHEKILQTIFESNVFSSYFGKCIKELTIAKNTKLQDSWISFLDLLIDDKSKLIKYAGNESLVGDFVKCDVNNKFPIYGEAMKKKFFKAIVQRRIWDDAAVTLSDHLPIFDPTHLIIRSVLDFLTIKNLNNLRKD